MGVRGRNLGLDALRTLAIAGMMAAHTSRMIEFDFRPTWCAWILLLEPIIPSLFLLMVGISLTLSLQRAVDRRAWYLRQARRAAILWIISMVFYLLEMGPRFPDFVVLSGILSTISYAILLVGALLLTPKKEWVIAGALAAGVALFLCTSGRGIFPLNAGDAPLLPLLPFALAGALWSLLQRRLPRPVFWFGLAGAGVAAALIHRYGLHALFTKPFGRSDASRLLAPPLFVHGEERQVGYYNLGPLLALCCLGLHLGALSVLGLLNQARGKAADAFSRLFILGRHSLEVYILHLTLLAILVVTFGLRPLKTAAQGNLVLAAVFTIVWLWCVGREHRKRHEGQPPE